MIQIFMDCDFIVEDQFGLVIVCIFLDMFCLFDDLGWNGVSVLVDGFCEGDEIVIFWLFNIGNVVMVFVKSYFIVEEDLMFLINGFDFDEEQDIMILFFVNGLIYWIIVEQVDGYLGNSFFI